jgi:hypothetical protein
MRNSIAMIAGFTTSSTFLYKQLSCTDIHKHLLPQKELLAAIISNNKYTFKKRAK